MEPINNSEKNEKVAAAATVAPADATAATNARESTRVATAAGGAEADHQATPAGTTEAKSASAWFPSGLLASSWIGREEKDVKGASSSGASPPSTPWGASWLQSAKEKTIGTLESMKKDLNEFSDTVQQEAATMAAVAASSVKSQAQFIHQQLSQQLSTDAATPTAATPTADTATTATSAETKADSEATAKIGSEEETGDATTTKADESNFFAAPSKWMRSIVETVQKLGVEDTTADEADFTEELRHDAGLPRKTVLDQFQLLQIQNDERTFLQAPSQNVDLYREWLTDFKIVEYNGEINILLGYNPKLREIYSRLVPAKVDNHTFWNRYFFKVHVQELDKEIADARAKSKDSGSNTIADDSVGSVGERDETWSMCSSANNDIQDLDDETAFFADASNAGGGGAGAVGSEESDDDGAKARRKEGGGRGGGDKEARRQRDELKTPQMDEADADEPLTDLDEDGDEEEDWEECAPSNTKNNNTNNKATNNKNNNKGKK